MEIGDAIKRLFIEIAFELMLKQNHDFFFVWIGLQTQIIWNNNTIVMYQHKPMCVLICFGYSGVPCLSEIKSTRVIMLALKAINIFVHIS